MKVWLDDERPAPEGWIQITTAHEAIAALKTKKVTQISLDHDLGLTANGTGYEVACHIELASFMMTLPRLVWTVHTQNPVGRVKITVALEHADKNWDKWDDLLATGSGKE